MALAGGWLLFRVIFCELADEDDTMAKTQNKTKHKLANVFLADEESRKSKEQQNKEQKSVDEEVGGVNILQKISISIFR